MNILLVELWQGKPFQVWTDDDRGGVDMYDFEWSTRSKSLCAHMSGGGEIYLNHADSKWWSEKGILPAKLANGKKIGKKILANRISAMPKKYTIDRLFQDALDSDTVWCSICRSHIAIESDICNHVLWCNSCGDWSTPSESCDHRKMLLRGEQPVFHAWA